MPQAVIAKDFDPSQKASLTIAMSCSEWDELGAALVKMKGQLFQTTANAILQGLTDVGYFVAKEP